MMKDSWKRMKMGYIYWWARRLPACDELLPLMSQRMDAPLPWRKRLILILHNHICDWCKRYADQLLILRKAMKQEGSQSHNLPVSEDSLPADARERIKRALNNS